MVPVAIRSLWLRSASSSSLSFPLTTDAAARFLSRWNEARQRVIAHLELCPECGEEYRSLLLALAERIDRD